MTASIWGCGEGVVLLGWMDLGVTGYLVGLGCVGLVLVCDARGTTDFQIGPGFVAHFQVLETGFQEVGVLELGGTASLQMEI